MKKSGLLKKLMCVVFSVIFILQSGTITHAATQATNVDSSTKYYYKKTSYAPTYYGYGTLYSYLERRKDPSWSGNTGSVDYYVYAKYVGNYTVSKIMSTWTCSATFLTSHGGGYGVTVGTNSASLSTSYSGSYATQNVTSYTYNTNGTKVAYYSSNYIVDPIGLFCSTSMKNAAFVQCKGEPIGKTIYASA